MFVFRQTTEGVGGEVDYFSVDGRLMVFVGQSNLFDCRWTTDNGVGGNVDYLTVDGRLTTVWVVKSTI